MRRRADLIIKGHDGIHRQQRHAGEQMVSVRGVFFGAQPEETLV
jgi:hypothetical protein